MPAGPQAHPHLGVVAAGQGDDRLGWRACCVKEQLPSFGVRAAGVVIWHCLVVDEEQAHPVPGDGRAAGQPVQRLEHRPAWDGEGEGAALLHRGHRRRFHRVAQELGDRRLVLAHLHHHAARGRVGGLVAPGRRGRALPPAGGRRQGGAEQPRRPCGGRWRVPGLAPGCRPEEQQLHRDAVL